jgi:hypothetical protein
MDETQPKLTALAITRRIARQIPVKRDLTEPEFRMFQCAGWIARDAIEQGDQEYFYGHIGSVATLIPCSTVPTVRAQWKRVYPQIYVR